MYARPSFIALLLPYHSESNTSNSPFAVDTSSLSPLSPTYHVAHRPRYHPAHSLYIPLASCPLLTLCRRCRLHMVSLVVFASYNVHHPRYHPAHSLYIPSAPYTLSRSSSICPSFPDSHRMPCLRIKPTRLARPAASSCSLRAEARSL